jgi:predicted anti-sigma-YlaC factor YlaD
VTGVGERGCARAQAWASLDLDGELSQLEQALLEAHVRRCPACAVGVDELRVLTETIRAEPLARPEAPVFAPRPAARVRSLGLKVALAATLAAIAGGLGVVAGTVSTDSGTPTAPDRDLAFLDIDGRRDMQGVRPVPEAPPAQREPAARLTGGV